MRTLGDTYEQEIDTYDVSERLNVKRLRYEHQTDYNETYYVMSLVGMQGAHDIKV